MFNLFHNVEYIILTKYQEQSLNKEQTRRSTKIKMDTGQQFTFCNVLSKNKFQGVWCIFLCTSVSHDYLVRVGAGASFLPEADVCSVVVLILLIRSPHWVSSDLKFTDYSTAYTWPNKLYLCMPEMRRHSAHQLGTIRIPLHIPMRRVWMAGFNFLVSDKHAKMSELCVPNHRGSPAYSTILKMECEHLTGSSLSPVTLPCHPPALRGHLPFLKSYIIWDKCWVWCFSDMTHDIQGGSPLPLTLVARECRSNVLTSLRSPHWCQHVCIIAHTAPSSHQKEPNRPSHTWDFKTTLMEPFDHSGDVCVFLLYTPILSVQN